MNLLATPLFVASISLLALNDFVLKAAFHNWLTGKLSDVAGLIAFTIFACAIFPSRRWAVATTISAAFVLWKSPYSQPAIDFVNNVLPLTLGRTPDYSDYSDYIALPGVWFACCFISRLRPWPVQRWLVGVTAVLSLILFTAISNIPMHIIKRTAVLPTHGDQSTVPAVEKQLQDVFDNIANQYGLRCTVCDPLSNGRLYVKNEADPQAFYLAVNFDHVRSLVFFDVSSVGPKAKENTPKIDRLHIEIENRLQTLFPILEIEEGMRSKIKTLQLGVGKRNSNTSSEEPENREDYEKAIKVVESVVSQLGIKRASSSRSHTISTQANFSGLIRPIMSW